MKNHLFACLILAMCMSTMSFAQNRGDVISTSVIFDFSDSQTQNAVNSLIPINLPNWVVNLLTDIDYGTKGYKVTYWTVDFNDNLTQATGLVVVPQGYSCNHDMFVYCHGTVFEKDQVPSNFSGAGNGVEVIFGLIYGGNGYITVMPDYLGLGDSPDFHLYVDEKTETTATIDLMVAAQNLSNTNGWGLTGDVLLSGYSQGGHAGMSVFKYMSQTNQPSGINNIATVGLGSGPYDLSNTQYNYILNNPFYPTREYILYTIASCQEAYGNIYTKPEDILVDPYADLYKTEILGQTGNTSWVPSPYTDMFQPGVYNSYVNNPNNTLKQCLANSDVADWYNTTNSSFFFCTNDEQVDYHNSLVAEYEMENNLPWYYFWYAGIINAVYVGGFSHFDCVIPYGILSKWQFDAYQSWCWWADDPNGEDKVQAANELIIRPTNYLYTEINLAAVNQPVRTIELIDFEGTVVKTFDNFNRKDELLRLETSDLAYGAYGVRATLEDGEILHSLAIIQEPDLIEHPDYSPLSYEKETDAYSLDLSLLPEEVIDLSIYNEEKIQIESFGNIGMISNYEFSLPNLEAGSYILEVKTAEHLFFLPLEVANEIVGIASEKASIAFPNPATGSFQVQAQKGELLQTVEIFDANGKLVFQINATGNNSIDLSPSIPTGIYEVRITTQTGTLRTERLIFVQQ